MVKRTLLLCAGLMAGASACSLSGVWGEDPPAPEFVIAPSGKSCSSPSLIATGSDSESLDALKCWEGELGRLWTDVQGRKRDHLSEKEITALVHRQIVRFDGDPKESLRILFSAKKVLGIDGDVSRAKLESWLEWLRSNRARIRSVYAKTSGYANSTAYLSYLDVRNAAELGSSFLRKAGWNLRSNELAASMDALVPPRSEYLRQSMTELGRVLINTAEAFCPNLSGGGDVWESVKLAECSEALVQHFEAGAPWFEYTLNPYAEHRMQEVERSLEFLLPKVRGWFSDPRLKPVQTKLWIRFAQQLGIRVDERSLENLDWIRTFSKKSNRYSIDPTTLITAFEIVFDWQKAVFQGLQWFNNCDFRLKKAWTGCVLQLTPEHEQRSTVLNTASRLRNPHYSDRAIPFNRQNFSQLMLFDAMSRRIMAGFDEDGDKVITIRSLGSRDELLDLLASAFKVQKNTVFVEELRSRLEGIPNEANQDDWVLRRFDPQGIAKLVTLMGEVLYRRDRKDLFFFDSILDNLGNFFPKNATHLDQYALTGVLSTIDSLGTYRDVMTSMDSRLETPIVVMTTRTGEPIVKRGNVVKSLSPILKELFPRLHRSCYDFGFERSCGTVFMNLIPGEKDDDLLYASDLDIVPIAGIFMENMLDRCDTNGDQRLAEKYFDGSDELDCGFTHLKDMVVRLMEARIIPDDASTRRVLGFVNSFFLTRPLGKISLARGTRKGVGWRYLPSMLHKDKATMGSVMALAAEVIDPDRVEQLEKSGLGRKKKKKDRDRPNSEGVGELELVESLEADLDEPIAAIPETLSE